MPFIGTIINLVKGSWDSIKIRSDEKKLISELNTELWQDLSVYDRFEFRNKLILSELFLKMNNVNTSIQKIKIIEESICYMKNEIEQAEDALKNRNATKLDVATLAVNIQDLTLNSIKEFENMNSKIHQFETKLKFTKRFNIFMILAFCLAIIYLILIHYNKLEI